MRCPYCQHTESRVLESRSTDEDSAIRRRRACLSCDGRFTTYERIETIPLHVVKRDGSRQPFDRQKILQGMLIACRKRPVPLGVLEETTSRIEASIRNRLVSEIPTEEIGQMIMAELREIDPVAYVRFASVYRQYHDLRRFRDELDALLAEADPGNEVAAPEEERATNGNQGGESS